MEMEKIRNLNPQELQQQEHETTEQLFRLKFQARTGQAGGLKKLRELRKDLARIKTIARQHQLGIEGRPANGGSAAQPQAAKPAASATKAKNTGAAKKKTGAAKKKTATKKARTEKK